MAKIEVTATASTATSAINDFAAAVRQTGDILGDFVTRTIQLNEAGKLAGGAIEQMDALGRKLTSTFEVTGNSAKFMGTQISANANFAKKQLEELQAAAAAAAAQKLGQGFGEIAKGLFPVPSAASLAQINSYSNAITNLQRAIAASGASSAEINNLFNKMAAGPAAFALELNKLPTQMQQVGRALLAVGASAEAAGQAGARGGQAFAISWQGLIRILEAQLFRRAISGVISAIQEGVKSALDYQIQLQQVGNVTGQQGPALQAFAANVRSLSEQFAVPLADTFKAAQTAFTSQVGDAAGGLNVLTQAMRLSQATGTELESSTKLLTTTMQAFHLSGDQAGRVANTFYLIAQRSRVPLDEMKNAMGRISQTAGALGVSMEQAGALFVTIGQQGGRPTEAFSLLNQVLGRVLQPTKELQQFLNRLGTPTGELAIQTFGLVGFLEKLSEAARNSPHALGDLAGSVRTLRGLMAITGDQTRIFGDNLRAISDNTGQLMEGAARVAETPAQRLRTEFEKLKNTFTADIGTAFLTAVVNISEKLGGTLPAVNSFTEALKTLILTFAGFRTVSVATSLVGAFGVAAGTAAPGVAALGASMALIGGAFVVGVALHRVLVAIGEGVDLSKLERIERAANRVREAGERARETIAASSQRQTEATNQLISRAFEGELQAAARAVAESQRVRDIRIRHQKDIQDAFKVASQTYLDGIRNELAASREAANKAKSDFETSRKSAETFQQQVGARGFQRQLQVEQNPFRAVELINNRFNEIQQRATEIFQNPRSSREQIESARAMFQELDRLNSEQDKHDFDIQKRRAELMGTYRTEIVLGQTIRSIHIDTSAAQARDNDLVAQRNQLEQQLQERLAKKYREQLQETARLQATQRIMEANLRRAEQFTILGADGKFKPEFQVEEDKRKGGGLDAIRTRWDEITRSTLAAAREQDKLAGGGTAHQDAALALLRMETQALNQQLAVHHQVTAAEERQLAVTNRRTAAQAETTRLYEQQRQIQQSLSASSTTLGDQLSRLQEGSPARLLNRPAGTGFSAAELQPTIDKYQAYRNALAEAQSAQEAFTRAGGQTNENATRLTTAIEALRNRAQAFSNVDLSSENLRRGLGITQVDIDRIKRFNDNAGNTGTVIGDAISRIQQGTGEDSPLNFVNRRLSAIDTNLTNMTTSMPAFVNNVNRINPVPLQQAAAAMQDMANVARAGVVLERLPAPGALSVPPGSIPGRAGGGLLGSGFSSRGPDDTLLWARRGEFIVNPESTQKFYSQLVAMNAGIQPRHYASGGMVTVGDINVTVQGGSTNERTVRDIAHGIKRELKRGTVRFD